VLFKCGLVRLGLGLELGGRQINTYKIGGKCEGDRAGKNRDSLEEMHAEVI
jgi:hypothetical protein